MTLHDADTRPAEAADDEPRRPPTPGGFSIRPAMIVLGLGVLILAIFVTLAIVSTHPPAAVKTSGPPAEVPGSTLRSEPAALALTPIIIQGEPPSNIVNAVTLPDRVRPHLVPEQRRRLGAVRRTDHVAL